MTTAAAVQPKSPGNPQGRPVQISRSFIQEAAFELFATHGYEATTVKMIADACGISRASFFNHFDAKVSVLWVEIDQFIEQIELELSRLRTKSPPSMAHNFSSLLTQTTKLISSQLQELPKQNPSWLLWHPELLGNPEELAAAVWQRNQRFQGIVSAHLIATLSSGFGTKPPVVASKLEAVTAALTQGALTSVTSWQKYRPVNSAATPADYFAEFFEVLNIQSWKI